MVELDALQKMYAVQKDKINPQFDKAVMAQNDLIFKIAAQKDFYGQKLKVIENARHHIFFKVKSFEDLLEI